MGGLCAAQLAFFVAAACLRWEDAGATCVDGADMGPAVLAPYKQ